LGFTLFVTPSVGHDLKTINLHLQPVIDKLSEGQKISEFQEFKFDKDEQTGAPIMPTIRRPTIDRQTLETKVVIEDNGYVVIGGLIRNRFVKYERKVPLLHYIPLLGWLFKSYSEQKITSNLVIILEAQIITPRGRTYRKEPAPDDGDIREGGVNRAPGQVSKVKRRGTNVEEEALAGRGWRPGEGSPAGSAVPAATREDAATTTQWRAAVVEEEAAESVPARPGTGPSRTAIRGTPKE